MQKHRALLESLGTGESTLRPNHLDIILISIVLDVLIDRTNLDEANKQIRRVLPNSLRFAVDTVGPDTASWCQDVLAAVAASRRSSPNETLGEYTNPIEKSNPDAERKLGHLVTLTGKPKTGCPDVQVHQVPIKLFHAHMMVGGYLSKWLYELLETGLLQLPGVDFVDGGLDSVNAALENLKAGNVSGRRLVVKLKETATDL